MLLNAQADRVIGCEIKSDISLEQGSLIIYSFLMDKPLPWKSIHKCQPIVSRFQNWMKQTGIQITTSKKKSFIMFEYVLNEITVVEHVASFCNMV